MAKPKQYKIDRWDHRNLWLSQSREIVVRPALRETATATSLASSGHKIGWGATIKSPNTGEPWHYLITQDPDTQEATLRVFDDEFQSITSLSLGPVTSGRVVASLGTIISPSTANPEFLINGPDLPPVYGIIGGGIKFAAQVDSVNPSTTAIDIPSGICIGWNSRIVIAQGRNLYISDARAPQTFVAANAAALNGLIFGLHILPGNVLAVATDAGVYYLPSDAAFTGQVVSGVFEQLTSYQATDFNQTAVSQGRLFGLSANGISDLTAEEREVALSDRRIPRRMAEPMEADYRTLRLWSTPAGPVVSRSYAWCMTDVERSYFSWWQFPSGYDLDLRGTLETREGKTLFLTPDRIVEPFGNTDFTGETIEGIAAGELPTQPVESRVLRQLHTSSDGYGEVKASVRGSVVKSQTVPQAGIVLGETTWDSTNFEERELRSRRFHFAERSDNHTAEIAAQNPGTRIGTINVEYRGVGRKRPTA